MTRRWLSLLAVLLCAASAAQAMSLRELRALEQADARGELFAQYYLIGVMEGAIETNAMASRQGRKPLFCLNGRRVDPASAQTLFRAELQRNINVYEADMPVELVLTNALASTYRCTD